VELLDVALKHHNKGEKGSLFEAEKFCAVIATFID